MLKVVMSLLVGIFGLQIAQSQIHKGGGGLRDSISSEASVLAQKVYDKTTKKILKLSNEKWKDCFGKKVKIESIRDLYYLLALADVLYYTEFTTIPECSPLELGKHSCLLTPEMKNLLKEFTNPDFGFVMKLQKDLPSKDIKEAQQIMKYLKRLSEE